MKPLRCATSYAVFSSWCKAYTENLIPATLFEYGVHERIIEKTTSSEVHLFRNSSNKTLFAVKRFPPNPFTIQNAQYVAQIYTEFEIGQLLRGHNQIIDIQGLVEVDGSWYQAMEYVPQSLYDLIHEIKGHVSTDNANCVLRQILEGVSYLHSQGIAHLELKLPNIIVDRDLQVKVIDFGTAMRYRGVDGEISSWVSGLRGTIPFLPPESFYAAQYDPHLADVWAIGLLFCQILKPYLPWKEANKEIALFGVFSMSAIRAQRKAKGQDSVEKDLDGDVEGVAIAFRQTVSSLVTLLPQESRHIIMRMLEPDPKLRAEWPEIWADRWVSSIVCQSDRN